jgi:glycosyltransferase involved in cell wall biosynthesis
MAADGGSPTPDVSVVIPSHRGGAPLRRAVRTVLEQGYPGTIEAVVVFDACEPTELGVDDLLGPTRTVIVLTNDRTRGPAGTRNRGIEASRGSWVAFLDDDDAWLAGKLTRQLAELERTGAGVATCGVRYVADGRYRDQIPAVQADMQRAIVAGGTFVPLQTMVVRREHLDRAGPFDEDMWVGEDTDLVLRLAGLTTFCGVGEPLIVMERGHTDRLSLDYERHLEGFRRLAAKHHELFDRWPTGRARRYWRLAGLALRSGDRPAAREWARRAVRLDPTSMKNVGMTAAAYLAPRSVFDRAFDAYQTVGWKPIAADVDVGPLV